MIPVESEQSSTVSDDPESRPGGIPLYVWIIGAALLAAPVSYFGGTSAQALELLPNVFIRLLKVVATPLIVCAILHAIVINDVRGRQGARMLFYYFSNTIVAICIGLALSRLFKPGVGADLSLPGKIAVLAINFDQHTAASFLYTIFPESIGDAFAKNHFAQLVVLTLAVGIGLAQIRNDQKKRGEKSYLVVVDLITIVFEIVMRISRWVIALVPIAVFGVVASHAGKDGCIDTVRSLLWFIVVLLIGFSLQISWYLLQLVVFAKMTPLKFARGAKEVMAISFGTAATGATIPMTLRALTGKLGVSHTSARLAARLGTNFNNDGTALYQASVVVFMAQAMDIHLSFVAMILVMLATVVTSIGAGQIPSGGFITLPLIFGAVGLPADQLPIILTIDWFLDRCRTSSNVLGDMTVAVLLDQTHEPEPEPHIQTPSSS